jgi:hypothetical protein
MNFESGHPEFNAGATAPQTSNIASSVYENNGKSPLDTNQRFNISIIH